MGLSIDGTACAGDLALAQSGKLNSRQAAFLQDELRKLPPMTGVVDRIDVAERIMFLDSAGFVAAGGPDALVKFYPEYSEEIPQGEPVLVTLFRPAFKSIDWNTVLRVCNDHFEHIKQACQNPSIDERRKAVEAIDREFNTMSAEFASLKSFDNSKLTGESSGVYLGHIMAKVLIWKLTPAFNAALPAEGRAQVRGDLSQLALALAGYRSDSGQYPDRLDALAPKYIPELPKDRFTDAADYIYKTDGKGYILYSVGPDGKDDGGRGPDDEPEGDDIAIHTPKEAE